MGKSHRRNHSDDDKPRKPKNVKPRRQNRRNVVDQIVQQEEDEFWEAVEEDIALLEHVMGLDGPQDEDYDDFGY